MTSTVKVSAHCDKNKQVEVHLNGVLQSVVADCESVEIIVHGQHEVLVKETLRPDVTAPVESTDESTDGEAVEVSDAE